MTMITKAEVKKVQDEVSAAVAEVLKKHGYRIGKNSCRYSEYDMKFAVEAIKDDANAAAERARLMFANDFKTYGVDYGTVVTDHKGNRKFTVEGFTRTGKLSARDTVDGKVYTGKTTQFFIGGESLEARYIRAVNDGSAFHARNATVTTRPVAPVIPFTIKTGDAPKA